MRRPVILLVDGFLRCPGHLRHVLDVQGLSRRNGRGCDAYVRDNPTDLILMDLRMPGLSGVDALRILRDDPASSACRLSRSRRMALDAEREGIGQCARHNTN